MRPARVLVCGTNYGRNYLDAIKLAGGAYELVGILALGSTRSQEVALKHGVPLYQKVEDLPPVIEIAVAAMGTAGSEIVLHLLERGIHVLCEHPQRTDWVKTALRIAASHGVCFHINGHFANLGAATAFTRRCKGLQQSAKASFFDVMVTDRTLYGALDILRRLLETFEPFQFAVVSKSPPFAMIQGILGGIRATFQIQCSVRADDASLEDGSHEYLVDQRLMAGFPSGTLTLMSVSGPVVWNANSYRVMDVASMLWTVCGDRQTTSGRLRQQRILANLQAMNSLVKNTREHIIPPEQTPEYILEVSRVWEAVGGMLYG